MRTSSYLLNGTLLMSSFFIWQSPTFASDEDEMTTMQKQLNAEILAKPFLAEQPEKVEAYIKEAEKKNLKPLEYTGIYWRRGYTCRDLLRYSWREYRNCRHYHRHHGHYYPYP